MMRPEDRTIARLFAKTVVAPNGCWEWTGSKDRTGYGQLWDSSLRKLISAHRTTYTLHRGAIPDGLELDHLCRNRACVNPGHLEPVTHAENVQRGQRRIDQLAITHCPQGHPYSGDNLYINSGRFNRCCRACRKQRNVDSYERKKARARQVAA